MDSKKLNFVEINTSYIRPGNIDTLQLEAKNFLARKKEIEKIKPEKIDRLDKVNRELEAAEKDLLRVEKKIEKHYAEETKGSSYGLEKSVEKFTIKKNNLLRESRGLQALIERLSIELADIERKTAEIEIGFLQLKQIENLKNYNELAEQMARMLKEDFLLNVQINHIVRDRFSRYHEMEPTLSNKSITGAICCYRDGMLAVPLFTLLPRLPRVFLNGSRGVNPSTIKRYSPQIR